MPQCLEQYSDGSARAAPQTPVAHEKRSFVRFCRCKGWDLGKSRWVALPWSQNHAALLLGYTFEKKHLRHMGRREALNSSHHISSIIQKSWNVY